MVDFKKNRRERGFGKSKGKSRDASPFSQWHYKKKDKLFKLQVDNKFREVHRFSEPKKYAEDELEEVGFYSF